MNDKNEKQIVVLLTDAKNEQLVLELEAYLKKLNKFEIIFCKPENDFVNQITSCFKKHIYKKTNARMVIVDDYGTMPFMVASKMPWSVVAQLEDEHSAFMTMGHNNSNVITIGSQVLGHELLLSTVKTYLMSEYEGGRHEVRIDMLKKLLEKEKI